MAVHWPFKLHKDSLLLIRPSWTKKGPTFSKALKNKAAEPPTVPGVPVSGPCCEGVCVVRMSGTHCCVFLAKSLRCESPRRAATKVWVASQEAGCAEQSRTVLRRATEIDDRPAVALRHAQHVPRLQVPVHNAERMQPLHPV